MSTIGHDLQHADPPIEALIVYNSNPVAVAPQSREVARGFAREDLFTVVLEHFVTDTADYADYVLPATTQLEHVDVHKSYGHLYVLANNAAIEPLGEALPNSEIFRRLAAKMGFDETCFSETDDELAAQAFKREGATAGFDWQRLKQSGWQRLDVPEKYAPFAEGGFATPSGRCEFYSEQVAALGLDPLPAYIAPYETPDGEPAGATLSACDHLAAGAQLPELDVRQRHELALDRRRADRRDSPARRARARRCRRRSRSHLQRSWQH